MLLRTTHHSTSLYRRHFSARTLLFFLSAASPSGAVHAIGTAAALTSVVRHASDTAFKKSHRVQYVATQAAELEGSAGAQGGDGNLASVNGEASSLDEKGGESAQEPEVVDFTTDVAPEKLEKLYHRSDRGTQFLSPSERRMFTKMIYDKFYKDEGTTAMDPAMLYQASLETQWVEEWMAGVARERHLSKDDARREVKKSLLERVDLHKPLSYIIGSQPFFGCDIHCEEPLLCPRPETEMWTHWLVYNYLGRVRNAHANGPPLNILDVCCGTGCIGVALAKHVPSAVVTALDILPQAVAVSQANARRNGVPDSRYHAIQSDMFDYFCESCSGTPPATTADTPPNGKGGDARSVSHRPVETQERPLRTLKPEFVGTFDVVVSNPPYVLPKQYIDLPVTITHWESKTALVGDDYRESRQYLYFKELCVHGARLLKPRRMRPAELQDTPNMLIEVGLQAHMVAELMEKSKLWKDVGIHLDYAQQERWVSAVSTH